MLIILKEAGMMWAINRAFASNRRVILTTSRTAVKYLREDCVKGEVRVCVVAFIYALSEVH